MSHLKRLQVSSRWLAVACALAVVGSSVAAVDCPELVKARERAAQVEKDLAEEVKRWNGIEQQRSTLEREIKAAEAKQSQLREQREANARRQLDEVNTKERAALAKLKQAQEHITYHTTSCDVVLARKAGKPVKDTSEHDKALNDAYAAREQASREISAAQRERAGLIPGGLATDAEWAAGREIATKKSELGVLQGPAMNAKARVEQLDLDKKNAQIALKSEEEKCRQEKAKVKPKAVIDLDRKIKVQEEDDAPKPGEAIRPSVTPMPLKPPAVAPPPTVRPSTPTPVQPSRPATPVPGGAPTPGIAPSPAAPLPNPPKESPAVDWANEFGGEASKLAKQEAARQVTNRGGGVTWTTDPDFGYEAGPRGITKPGENVERGIVRNSAGGATVEVAEQQLSKAALDEAAQRRFGKRYDELLPSQRVELDSERAGPDALAALLRDAGKKGTHMKDWVKKYMDKFVAPDIVKELSSPPPDGK